MLFKPVHFTHCRTLLLLLCFGIKVLSAAGSHRAGFGAGSAPRVVAARPSSAALGRSVGVPARGGDLGDRLSVITAPFGGAAARQSLGRPAGAPAIEKHLSAITAPFGVAAARQSLGRPVGAPVSSTAWVSAAPRQSSVALGRSAEAPGSYENWEKLMSAITAKFGGAPRQSPVEVSARLRALEEASQVSPVAARTTSTRPEGMPVSGDDLVGNSFEQAIREGLRDLPLDFLAARMVNLPHPDIPLEEWEQFFVDEAVRQKHTVADLVAAAEVANRQRKEAKTLAQVPTPVAGQAGTVADRPASARPAPAVPLVAGTRLTSTRLSSDGSNDAQVFATESSRPDTLASEASTSDATISPPPFDVSRAYLPTPDDATVAGQIRPDTPAAQAGTFTGITPAPTVRAVAAPAGTVTGRGSPGTVSAPVGTVSKAPGTPQSAAASARSATPPSAVGSAPSTGRRSITPPAHLAPGQALPREEGLQDLVSGQLAYDLRALGYPINPPTNASPSGTVFSRESVLSGGGASARSLATGRDSNAWRSDTPLPGQVP